jgi:predicted nucleic acid-binding protein
MTDLVFVDTNVLIYAVDEADPKKQAAAAAWRAELWKSKRGRVSFQVLQEFYVKVMQKWPEASTLAQAEVRDLLSWKPIAASAHLMESAWTIQDRFRFSFWDSLIVAAAKAAECRYLLTEDLQHDQELDGVTVVNPFLQDASSLR